jgi:hypothetical protein
MSKNIIFTDTSGFNFFPPKPAVKQIPDWYKNSPEYVNDQGKKIVDVGQTAHTIKKCMPVFDAITAGYILYTQSDIQISHENGFSLYTCAVAGSVFFHSLEQAQSHPLRKEGPFPKFNNLYAITTPPGYSVLFKQPMHRESVFTIFEGIVDTDTYKAPVSFPFVLKNSKWEGIIPAGTPMAQVIPFKRDSWEHKIGSKKEQQEQERISRKLRTMFFNSYKRQFWSKKYYN